MLHLIFYKRKEKKQRQRRESKVFHGCDDPQVTTPGKGILREPSAPMAVVNTSLVSSCSESVSFQGVQGCPLDVIIIIIFFFGFLEFLLGERV